MIQMMISITMRKKFNMCGIHGTIINKKEINADNFNRDAFVANQLRGMDSSGLFLIKESPAESYFDYKKLPIPGQYFIQDKQVEDMLATAGNEKVATVCHVRHATVGRIDINNAHPFEVVNKDDTRTIIGVHNGTISNWKSHKDSRYFSTDSEWCFHRIMEEGIEVLKEIDGAYCLVWWDSDDPDVINMIRNEERPMHISKLKSGGIAFASEEGMLYWLMNRNKLKYDGKVLFLDTHTHYKFPISDPQEYTKTKAPKYERPTNNYLVTTNSSSKTPTYKSAMEKVEDILTSIYSKFNKESNKATPKSNRVTKKQYDSAVEAGLIGKVVDFLPVGEYLSGTEGVAYCNKKEYTAHTVEYTEPFITTEIWKCPILGIDDDNADDCLLFLGKPVYKSESQTAIN